MPRAMSLRALCRSLREVPVQNLCGPDALPPPRLEARWRKTRPRHLRHGFATRPGFASCSTRELVLSDQILHQPFSPPNRFFAQAVGAHFILIGRRSRSYLNGVKIRSPRRWTLHLLSAQEETPDASNSLCLQASVGPVDHAADRLSKDHCTSSVSLMPPLGRSVLQQDQTMPQCRDATRQACCQLPRVRRACFDQAEAAHQ